MRARGMHWLNVLSIVVVLMAAFSHQCGRAAEPTTGLGQLVTRDPQSGNFVRLDIQRYHVNVVMQPPVALVQIDQSFFNPFENTVEGTFVFNLPEGASVSRFAMYVTKDRLVEGELIERGRAANVYQTIVSGQRDPAILEQLGSNLFRMRVFPIFAKDFKRILLDFTVPVPTRSGNYQFALPLLNDRQPIADFGLTGRIAGPVDASTVRMPGLPPITLKTESDGSVSFAYAAKAAQPPANWEIQVAAPSGTESLARVYDTHPLERPNVDEQYFVTTVPAALHPAAKEPTSAADVLVLVDTSGSVRNLPIAEKVARGIVQHLRRSDRVQIGCVDATFRPLTERWFEAGSEELEPALKAIGQQLPLGASFLDHTIRFATERFPQEPADKQRRRVVIYVGDGLDSNHSSTSDDTTQLKRLTNFSAHAVLTSDLAGTQWIRQLALDTHGRVFVLSRAQAVQTELIDWLRRGVPVSARVTDLEVDGLRHADFITDKVWSVGEELFVYGRREKKDELRLSLKVDGKPMFLKPKIVTKDADDVFVGRLWAQRKLDLWSQDYQQPVSANSSNAEIVALSQEWSLLSPFTAFLVLESEADYGRWKIERHKRRRYWQPAGAAPQQPVPPNSIVLEREKLLREEQQALEQRRKEQIERSMQSLKQAEQAFQDRKFDLARMYAYWIEAADDLEVAKVQQELQKKLRQEASRDIYWSELGLRQVLFDRTSFNRESRPPAMFLPIIAASPSREFRANNPHYDVLRQKVKLPTKTMVFETFLKHVEQQTHTKFRLDIPALEQAGIATDTEINFDGMEGLPLQSMLRHVLRPLSLSYIDDDKSSIWITTDDEIHQRLKTRVYPVSDLEDDRQTPRWDRLSNPHLDDEIRSRLHLEKQLKQPLSLKFDKQPLVDVVRTLRQKLDVPILIDESALNAAGVELKTVIDDAFQDVPANEAINAMLKSFYCQWLIQDDALIITTIDEANNRLETRLYPASGLVAERRLSRKLPTSNLRGMGFGGGFGGGGGSFGGGGGFPTSGNLGGGLGGFVPDSSNTTSVSPAGETLGLSIVGPPEAGAPNAQRGSESGQQGTKITREGELSLIIKQTQTVLPPDLDDVISILMEESSGGWETDGSGTGTISFHPATRTLMVRQTNQVHQELKVLTAQLRALSAAQHGPQWVSRRPRSNPNAEWNPSILTNILMEETSGSWESDGSGYGVISAHPLTQALAVTQTCQVHHEIERQLTLLRRAKLMTSMMGPTDLDVDLMMPLPNLIKFTSTDWPISPTDESRIPTDAEVKRRRENLSKLSVRRVDPDWSHEWQQESVGKGTRRVAVRRFGTRLECETPERLIRTDGRFAAVAFPNLTLVEIDAWGDAARNAIDAELPWLPHRSNAELAEMFDISVAQQDDTTRTLKLSVPHLSDCFVLATYRLSDGALLMWVTHQRNEASLEYQFEGPRVRALTVKEPKLVESWLLVKTHDPREIPDIEFGWQPYVISRPSEPERSKLHQFQSVFGTQGPAAALPLIEAELKTQPNQPLWHLLRATVDELLLRPKSPPSARQRESLQLITHSSATGLWHYIREMRFPSFSAGGLLPFFAHIPLEQLTESQAEDLCELADVAGQFELALKYLNRCEAAAAESGKSQTQPRLSRAIRRVEYAAERDINVAIKQAEPLKSFKSERVLMVELADLFARHDQSAVAVQFYDLALADEKLNNEDRASLLYDKAKQQTADVRWHTLVAAMDATPQNLHFVNMMLDEISDEHPSSAAWTELAKQARVSSVRSSLLKRQTEQSTDAAEQSKILLQLLDDKEFSLTETAWLIKRLRTAGLNAELVKFVDQLIQQRTLPNDLLLNYMEALKEVGRHTDSIRAATQRDEKFQETRPFVFPAMPAMQTGGGFF